MPVGPCAKWRAQGSEPGTNGAALGGIALAACPGAHFCACPSTGHRSGWVSMTNDAPEMSSMRVSGIEHLCQAMLRLLE